MLALIPHHAFHFTPYDCKAVGEREKLVTNLLRKALCSWNRATNPNRSLFSGEMRKLCDGKNECQSAIIRVSADAAKLQTTISVRVQIHVRSKEEGNDLETNSSASESPLS